MKQFSSWLLYLSWGDLQFPWVCVGVYIKWVARFYNTSVDQWIFIVESKFFFVIPKFSEDLNFGIDLKPDAALKLRAVLWIRVCIYKLELFFGFLQIRTIV